MRKVKVAGVGEYLPGRVLTNAGLEKMVDTSDEWITTRTGIKTRRIVRKGETSGTMAVQAAKKALKYAKLKPEKIELIIVATVTPDMQFPATACFVQSGIGAKNAVCFDISAACAGFVYALVLAQQFISRGAYNNALIIGSETLSSITDWTDRNTCVLFGDGAGAVVLKSSARAGILSTYLGADGTMTDLLMVPAGGSKAPASRETVDKRLHFIKMRGNELFKMAVNIMVGAAREALDRAGLTIKDVDCFIPHQANLRIILAVAKRLKLPESTIYLNIQRYGNMSSASAAVALCEAVKEGFIKKNDIVLLDTFGAGLVWGACVIRW
ncbi:MAG: ketoacyl-ACP synthase III [Candidatus Omnitrophica bacterium]|nr:ketoacyl-ACP synthase III [Candidatus Omnitrophota bacterium]